MPALRACKPVDRLRVFPVGHLAYPPREVQRNRHLKPAVYKVVTPVSRTQVDR